MFFSTRLRRLSSLEISLIWFICKDYHFIISFFFLYWRAVISILWTIRFCPRTTFSLLAVIYFLLLPNAFPTSIRSLDLDGGVKFLRGQANFVVWVSNNYDGFLIWMLIILDLLLVGGEVWLGVDGSKPLSLEKDISKGSIYSSTLLIYF